MRDLRSKTNALGHSKVHFRPYKRCLLPLVHQALIQFHFVTSPPIYKIGTTVIKGVIISGTPSFVSVIRPTREKMPKLRMVMELQSAFDH